MKPVLDGLRIIILVAAASQVQAQTSPACSVAPFRGATGPQGAAAEMRVLNNGQPCSIANFGIPAERRQPASTGAITQPPSSGTAQFVPPLAIYTPRPGFRGEDHFVYEATAKDALQNDLRLRVRVRVLVSAAASQEGTSAASAPARSRKKITMIHMGGNDCAPCVVWRALELPKLLESPAFKDVEFVYVTKVIKSAVPPMMFLPEAAKPYKRAMDLAGGGMEGSPQTVLFVDGELYDYHWNVRSAEDILAIVSAIRADAPYPFDDRCLRRIDRLRCAVPAGR